MPGTVGIAEVVVQRGHQVVDRTRLFDIPHPLKRVEGTLERAGVSDFWLKAPQVCQEPVQ